MRKQFDLNYYLEHPDVKVVTRDGRNARITGIDNKSLLGYSITALIQVSSFVEATYCFKKSGRFMGDKKDSVFDLFFDLSNPEKKKVPLTYYDLQERVKEGKTMWVAGDSSTILITYFAPDGYVCYGDLSSSTRELADSNDHFADGDPCWKEVDSCDTCTNDKGCVTCNNGDQWEGDGNNRI